MRALLQRVTDASVRVDGCVIGEIGAGLMILVCAMEGDTPEGCTKLAQKVSKLRIFTDDAGKMNRSILDAGGSVLAISQFTLAADTSRGTRPGFLSAAKPDVAETLYEQFIAELRAKRIKTAKGQFGADMKVTLTNDGPVTIWLET